MSFIPYQYDMPIPVHFRRIGWLKDSRTVAFLYWIFSECSSEPKRMMIDGFKELNLDPYEFYFTRPYMEDKSGLTAYEIRRQIERLESQQYIKKVSSKTTSRYIIYKWSEIIFSKNDNRQNAIKSPVNSTDKSPEDKPTNSQAKIPVSDEFLARKKMQYEGEDVEMACTLFITRYIEGPYPVPMNVNGWFNDCLRRRYWEENGQE